MATYLVEGLDTTRAPTSNGRSAFSEQRRGAASRCCASATHRCETVVIAQPSAAGAESFDQCRGPTAVTDRRADSAVRLFDHAHCLLLLWWSRCDIRIYLGVGASKLRQSTKMQIGTKRHN